MLTLKQIAGNSKCFNWARKSTDQTENEANVCVARTTFRTLYDDGIMKKKIKSKNEKQIVKKN